MSTEHSGLVEDYGGEATYHQRVWQYDWVIDTMVSLGLEAGDVIYDLGAGYCDLDMRLRQRGWFGKYVPVDGMIDGTELENCYLTRAHFYVSIDTFEHLVDWETLLKNMQVACLKGVVVVTPDGGTIDVYAMHETHFSSLEPDHLTQHGLVVAHTPISNETVTYQQMMGYWSPKWAKK